MDKSCPRLFPTFSWRELHNGGLSTTQSASERCLTLWYSLLWKRTHPLQLRASSRMHSQCTRPSSFTAGSVRLRPRPVITNLQLVKPCYEIVKLQNESFALWYPYFVYGKDFSRKVSHFTRRNTHKIYCFLTYYTCRYRKVNQISCP